MKQTSLTKDEEALYQLWAKGFNVPTGGSYDRPRFFKEKVLGQQDQGLSEVSQYDNQLHFTDEYKMPGHPTFSMQSKYWKEGMPKRDWVRDYYVDFDQGKILKDTTASPQNKFSSKVYDYFRRGQKGL